MLQFWFMVFLLFLLADLVLAVIVLYKPHRVRQIEAKPPDQEVTIVENAETLGRALAVLVGFPLFAMHAWLFDGKSLLLRTLEKGY